MAPPGDRQASLDRYEEALDCFNHALSLNASYAPKPSSTWAGRRSTWKGPQMRSMRLKKVLALQPESADAYYYKGLALVKKEQDDEAVEAFNHAIAINRDTEKAYHYKGVALARHEQYEEENRLVDAALKDQERLPGCRIRRAGCSTIWGNTRMRLLFDQALSRDWFSGQCNLPERTDVSRTHNRTAQSVGHSTGRSR